MRLSPLALVPGALAISVQLGDTNSVTSAMSNIASDMVSYYVGTQPGQVPGLLPGGLSCDPNNPTIYCWWEAGAMFGSLINYWQYTNDSQYNPIVSQALQFQRGPDSNFNPPNQSKSMGIDDQAFWSFSAMDAVEANFPESTEQDAPSWLAMAQAVYNFQKDYWDTTTCGGGFRWQVFSFNAGYNLKNAVSNGGNFQLSARLAYVTRNESYAAWATTVYEWMESSALMQTDPSTGTLYIWDNTDSNNNCTDQTRFVWTYNYGTLLVGAAYMYNYTNGDPVWLNRVTTILNSTFTLFFPSQYGGNIMSEIQCESTMVCDQDQKSFKAYLARWMAVTSLLVPQTAELIIPKLQASAQAAAGQCDGGSTGSQCGTQWYTTTWDGSTGVGQQVSIELTKVALHEY